MGELLKWRYAIARMHRLKLSVSLDGQLAQVFPEISRTEIYNLNGAYSVMRRELKKP